MANASGKRRMSNEYGRKTSSPNRVLVLIGLIVLAEPLSATLLYPFIYFMVKSFGYDTETAIGYRAGFITSTFYVTQMCTTPFWGHISDRYGRKVVLLIGLFGGAASMALFGLSKSLLWAMLSRGLCGALNGNIGVARTFIGEYAEQANIKLGKAFSIFGLCGALGYIVGPFIGGVLSDPAERLGLAGPGGVFARFPYLLPCLVPVVFNIAVMCSSYFLLPETRRVNSDWKSEEDGRGRPQTIPPSLEDVQETTPLLRTTTYLGPIGGDQKKWLGINQGSWACIVATGFLAMQAIMFDEGYALFAASSLERGTGLGFQPAQIALSLSIMGVVIFFTQIIVFHHLNSSFDTIDIWWISAGIFAVAYPAVSLVPLFQDSLVRWALLLTALGIRFAAVVLAWTSLNILVNQVIEPTNRGLVTSVVQSMASLVRAIGPTAGGSLWSWSLSNNLPAPLDFHIFFITLCVLSVGQGFVGFSIPKKYATRS